MKKLSYVVEDNTIAELLGIQNFTNKESAILELVKNAYDAQASFVNITFSNQSIIFLDDGMGMDESTILNNWMHVGKSDKEYILISNDKKDDRVLAGAKGIGRFALARLGSYVEVISHKKGEYPVKWTTNWNESFFEVLHSEKIDLGTRIEISLLRDQWTEKSIKKLIKYLSVTYNDDKMRIVINPNYGQDVSYVFRNPCLGKNYVSKISLSYYADDMRLHCIIENDEFTDNAKKYCPQTDINYFVDDIYIVDELSGDADVELKGKELHSALRNLGDFSSNLFFSLKNTTDKDVKNFFYKYPSLQNRFEFGVALYRNAFSISSFEGEKDWLGLNARSRKSPAAATHPTGMWRVRANQISGNVEIDKKRNCFLRDLSNRQGIEETEYYKLFTKIIIIGISTFERYRQSIIRSIDKKNEKIETPITPMIDYILKERNKGILLSSDDVKNLVKEISAVKEETKNIRDEKESSENQYRYDVRILNILSTSGLKASSIAHELKNDRNNIEDNYNSIVDALKEYGFWDELNSLECTKYSYNNVPYLLDCNKQINQKIVAFMNTMLDEIEKKKFSHQNLFVKGVMEKIKLNWMRDYSSLIIHLDIEDSIYFDSSEDIFTAIFDNLILNSWQQNKTLSRINIEIMILQSDNFLEISYSDTGCGLSPKYLKNPMRILDVHESSREDGHGLGMWIVNNTIRMTGGNIISIVGDNGFHFKFVLGDKI